MSPQEIGQLVDRRMRVLHVKRYRDESGRSYRGVAEDTGLTRNQVAADIRDCEKWFGQDAEASIETPTSAAPSDQPGTSSLSDQTPGESTYDQVRPKFVASRQLLRACVFDIETTDFSATGYEGILVCCSFLPLDADRPHTLSLAFDDKTDEQLVRAVLDELGRYDILIGHYISGYDLPWLYTRADQFGLGSLRRWLTYDTYYAAKALKLRTDRKSLAFLVDHFRIEGTKTAIYPRAWHNIRSRDYGEFMEAHDNIIEHCEFDVLANRNLFDRLLPKTWGLPQNQFKVTFWAGELATAQEGV